MNRDKLYLLNIIESISLIAEYTQDGHAAFLKSRMIQDAVIRNFEIMGEATKRLSQNIREAYPDVDWRDVAGFRDVLIHNYLGVDLVAVWNIIRNSMPTLKLQISVMLQSLDQEEQ